MIYTQHGIYTPYAPGASARLQAVDLPEEMPLQRKPMTAAQRRFGESAPLRNRRYAMERAKGRLAQAFAARQARIGAHWNISINAFPHYMDASGGRTRFVWRDHETKTEGVLITTRDQYMISTYEELAGYLEQLRAARDDRRELLQKEAS